MSSLCGLTNILFVAVWFSLIPALSKPMLANYSSRKRDFVCSALRNVWEMWRKREWSWHGCVGMDYWIWAVRMVGSKMSSIFQGLLPGIYSSICRALPFAVTVIAYTPSQLIKPSMDLLSKLGVILSHLQESRELNHCWAGWLDCRQILWVNMWQETGCDSIILQACIN